MLEAQLNIALSRLRLIEDALHGNHTWKIKLLPSGQISPASFTISDYGVNFIADFPTQTEPAWAAELLMDGDPVHTNLEEIDGRGHPFSYSWDIWMEQVSMPA